MWDDLHLYIANNLDWMEHWIEYCEECFGRLSSEGVSEMIKTTHRHQHQFPDLTSQRDVDLAYGLKDKKESKLFTRIFLVTSHFFNVFGLFKFSNIFSKSYMMFINSQCIFYLLSMLQLKHHKAMWCNGRKFRIKMLDDKMKTSDCGITAVFKVTNVSSRSDKHPKETENRYYGHL